MLSLGEAARQAGVAKTTIHRAVKSGKISAQKKDDGTYSIDPAELFRVYRPEKQVKTVTAEQKVTPYETPETAREIALLREMIDELKTDRDAWRQQAERLLLNAPTVSEKTRPWWSFKR